MLYLVQMHKSKLSTIYMYISCADRPSNLTILDGTQLFWNGPTCFEHKISYRVELMITRVDDSQHLRLINVTSGTMIRLSLFSLLPGVEYTVSVSAYGSSCITAPATVNFIAPAYVSTAVTSKCSYSYYVYSLIK